MSDSYGALITVSPPPAAAVDLTATYPAMANVQSWVQNRGGSAVTIWFSQSATPPTNGAGGVVLNPGGVWGGNAPHVWALALNTAASVSVGLS